MSNRDLSRLIAVTAFIEAIATSFGTTPGMVVASFAGVYLTVRIWFIDHPLSYLYDLKLWASFIATAVLATLTYGILCGGMSAVGITTRACGSIGLSSALSLNVWFTALPAGFLWLVVRLILWWQTRRN